MNHGNWKKVSESEPTDGQMVICYSGRWSPYCYKVCKYFDRDVECQKWDRANHRYEKSMIRKKGFDIQASTIARTQPTHWAELCEIDLGN